jgi:hypothetical protein
MKNKDKNNLGLRFLTLGIGVTLVFPLLYNMSLKTIEIKQQDSMNLRGFLYQITTYLLEGVQNSVFNFIFFFGICPALIGAILLINSED